MAGFIWSHFLRFFRGLQKLASEGPQKWGQMVSERLIDGFVHQICLDLRSINTSSCLRAVLMWTNEPKLLDLGSFGQIEASRLRFQRSLGLEALIWV